MKRILYAIITASVLLAGCSDGISLTPGISFITATPEIFEETAIFRIIGQPFKSADSVRVAVTFGGSAEMGVDYDASADHFVFSKESLTDSIVISTRKLGTGKTVNLSLEIPEGFTAGKYATSGFRLQDKFGLLSFMTSKAYVADTTECMIMLHDSTGRTKVLSKDYTIGITVNKEKSTAVEGVDFKFINTTDLTIPEGSPTASFRLMPLGDAPQAGKDKVVLNVTGDARFDTGLYPEIEIGLLKSSLKVLDGSWQIDTLVTDSLHFEKFWGDQCTGYSLVPEFNRSDAFDISFSTASFTPFFPSELRHYFIEDSSIAFGDEIDITDLDGNSRKVQLLSLDRTNRYFSADTTSADTLSYIGLHLTKNSETQMDMLELYILDHTSMSFMPELESGMKYGTEKPVATEPGMYLNATFRKTR